MTHTNYIYSVARRMLLALEDLTQDTDCNETEEKSYELENQLDEYLFRMRKGENLTVEEQEHILSIRKEYGRHLKPVHI